MDWKRVWRIKRIPVTVFAAMLLVVVASAVELLPIAIGCGIKADVDPHTRERVYLVPGDPLYFVTRINPLRGERWFCSEEAATAAGWYKRRYQP